MGKKKQEPNAELPRRIHVEDLGTLRLTAVLDETVEYQTTLQLGGRRVTFDLYTDEAGRLDSRIKRARNVVEHFTAIQKKIHRYVERNIFPSYNALWRSDKQPFTLEQVMSRLKLDYVSISGPKMTLWFRAGNLFHGHILQLRMGERHKILDHDMPG